MAYELECPSHKMDGKHHFEMISSKDFFIVLVEVKTEEIET